MATFFCGLPRSTTDPRDAPKHRRRAGGTSMMRPKHQRRAGGKSILVSRYGEATEESYHGLCIVPFRSRSVPALELSVDEDGRILLPFTMSISCSRSRCRFS